MEAIEISSKGESSNSVTGNITAAVLQPLSSFTSLRVFGLKYSNDFDNTNVGLSGILSKCPRLRELVLKPVGYCEGSHSSLTLAVLCALAKSNSELERITIHIDVTKDDFSKRTPRPFGKLKQLYVADSPISLPSMDVSTYLIHILSTPEVLYTYSTDIWDNRTVAKWFEVGCELKRIMGNRGIDPA